MSARSHAHHLIRTYVPPASSLPAITPSFPVCYTSTVPSQHSISEALTPCLKFFPHVGRILASDRPGFLTAFRQHLAFALLC
ncbi:hypothetical protein E2C01_029165 [Portunus trituberculatus]|uniref:Uncharacterized protein n=1 Tax=Portunus trituberculatus TaxID=210409 RepID=A0A5B7EMM2_PORTR|nr:hypothetical protein [Portunus trituberculatus]